MRVERNAVSYPEMCESQNQNVGKSAAIESLIGNLMAEKLKVNQRAGYHAPTCSPLLAQFDIF